MPDNLLNPKADRTPNWDKWRLIPRLTPSQCAALWANIDPDKLRYDGFKGFMESQEFKDRLDLVTANLYGALKSKNGKVDLRLFAAWVREVQGTGWDASAELLAIGDHRPQNVNWDYWGTLDLWPLDAACKLLCGDDPNEPTREGDIENPDPSTRRTWVNLFHKAQASILGEKLRARAGCVYPAEFIVWARGKGAQIPPQLIAMTDDHDPRKQKAPTIAEGKVSGEPPESPLLPFRAPDRQDDWCRLIRAMKTEFESEHQRSPNETEAWARLRTTAPKSYDVKSVTYGNDEAISIGNSVANNPLDKKAFVKRWRRYTGAQQMPLRDNKGQ